MTTQKHAFWLVPNYDGSTSTGGVRSKHPISYLRLGSMTSSVAELSTEKLSGDDLLHRAGIKPPAASSFFDQSNDGEDRNMSGAGAAYRRDDGKKRNVAKTATQLTAELMTRGGWRDHTDGNRISTTRGDRVDFVYGNYKRIIFGRQQTSAVMSKSTWESSGGHNHDTTTTPGEVKSISWVSASDCNSPGTWKVVEETEHANALSRYQGRVVEYFDGDVIQSNIGVKQGPGDSIAPMIGVLAGTVGGFVAFAAVALTRANAGQSATPAAPLLLVTPFLGWGIGAAVAKGTATVDNSDNPIIEEDVYATTVIDHTEAASIHDTTVAQTEISETTHISTYLDEEELAPTRIDNTGDFGDEVVFSFDSVLADHIENSTTFDQRHLLSVGAVSVGISFVAAEKHIFGNKKDGPFGPSFPAYNVSVFIGLKRSFELGVSAEFFLGGQLNLALASVAAVDLAKHVDISLGFSAANRGDSNWAYLNEQKAVVADLEQKTQATRVSGGNLE